MLSSATKTAADVTKASAENDLRNAAQNAVNEGKDALNSVSDYASEAGEKVRGIFDKTVDQTSRFSETIEAEIKSNPIRSSAIALGAGFILGALLTRR